MNELELLERKTRLWHIIGEAMARANEVDPELATRSLMSAESSRFRDQLVVIQS